MSMEAQEEAVTGQPRPRWRCCSGRLSSLMLVAPPDPPQAGVVRLSLLVQLSHPCALRPERQPPEQNLILKRRRQ